MKSILNKTRRPLRVPLPRGKILHLGPNHTGQIADHAVDHPGFKSLLEAGDVEIVAEGAQAAAAADNSALPHESTHGHTQKSTSHSMGNR